MSNSTDRLTAALDQVKKDVRMLTNPKTYEKMSQNQVIGTLTVLLLVVGVAAGVYLGGQQQELRQQASNAYPQCSNTSGACDGVGAGGRCIGLAGTCQNSETNAFCSCIPDSATPTTQACVQDGNSCGSGSVCCGGVSKCIGGTCQAQWCDRNGPNTTQCGDVPVNSSCGNGGHCSPTTVDQANAECVCTGGGPNPTATPVGPMCTDQCGFSSGSDCVSSGGTPNSNSCVGLGGGICCRLPVPTATQVPACNFCLTTAGQFCGGTQIFDPSICPSTPYCACGTGPTNTPRPTNTSVPNTPGAPTNTPVPNPTDVPPTNVPPTQTPGGPTATNTPTNTPVIAPICVNVIMNNPASTTPNTAPNIGDIVTLTCSQIVGATRYEFRFRLPDLSFVSLNPSTATINVSQQYQIPSAGSFRAYCRPCAGLADSTCAPWEN